MEEVENGQVAPLEAACKRFFLYIYLTVDKNILRRRLGVLENLYSGNPYAFYYSLSKYMAEVTLGDIAYFP